MSTELTDQLAAYDRLLARLEMELSAARAINDNCERLIAEHKAAHPPLVKLGQGEYEKEYR